MLLLKELHHDNIVSLLGAGFLPDGRRFVALVSVGVLASLAVANLVLSWRHEFRSLAGRFPHCLLFGGSVFQRGPTCLYAADHRCIAGTRPSQPRLKLLHGEGGRFLAGRRRNVCAI